MRQKSILWIVALSLILTFAVVGCKKKTTAESTPVPVPAQAPVEEPRVVEPPREFVQPEIQQEEVDLTAQQINEEGILQTVYFDYDKAALSEAARTTLRANADWLKDSKNAKWKVEIQGHCDERGTIEYNIELGQRRASAVRDYLSTLGVGAARMRVVSYGEERPAVPGHGESAWSKNRRAEFYVE